MTFNVLLRRLGWIEPRVPVTVGRSLWRRVKVFGHRLHQKMIWETSPPTGSHAQIVGKADFPRPLWEDRWCVVLPVALI